jgi:hypothetical protein
MQAANGSGRGVAVGTAEPSTGVWTFVVGTYEKADGNVYLYENAVETASAAYAQTLVAPGAALTMGTITDTLEYTGDIALPKLLSYRSTQGKIKQIYEEERSWFGV